MCDFNINFQNFQKSLLRKFFWMSPLRTRIFCDFTGNFVWAFPPPKKILATPLGPRTLCKNTPYVNVFVETPGPLAPRWLRPDIRRCRLFNSSLGSFCSRVWRQRRSADESYNHPNRCSHMQRKRQRKVLWLACTSSI